MFRQAANEVLIASMARWEEHLKGLFAGVALPGAQGGSGAFKRKTRSFGYSDGGQDEHAAAPEDFQRQIFQELEELEELKAKAEKESWRLRSFIEIDNHSAVDVGHLRRDIRPFCVQKQNFSEDYPEAAIREGADELTFESRGSQNVESVHQY